MALTSKEKQRRYRQSQQSKLDKIYDQNVQIGKKVSKINIAIDNYFEAKEKKNVWKK